MVSDAIGDVNINLIPTPVHEERTMNIRMQSSMLRAQREAFLGNFNLH